VPGLVYWVILVGTDRKKGCGSVISAQVSGAIEARLGEAGVREVLGSLWCGDCQICGGVLAGQDPAVSVDQLGRLVTATLAHARCRASSWDRDTLGPMAEIATLTWCTATLAADAIVAGVLRSVPVLLLNPSLEQVVLRRGEDGWAVTPRAGFLLAGLQPADQQAEKFLDRPVPGAVAGLDLDRLTLILPAMQENGIFTAPVEDPHLRALILSQGGILLVVTHVLDLSAPLTAVGLGEVLDDHRTVCGWVPLTPLS